VVKDDFNTFMDEENLRVWMGFVWLWRVLEYRLP